MQAYLGIDPGINKQSPGCAALLINRGVYFLHDWKSEQAAKNTLVHWKQEFILKAAIERPLIVNKPNIFPNMKLAINFGFWCGLTKALDIDCEIIDPRVWQSRMLLKCAGKTTKERSYRTVREIIEGAEKFIYSITRHHGRADALLIAKYLKNQNEFSDLYKNN